MKFIATSLVVFAALTTAMAAAAANAADSVAATAPEGASLVLRDCIPSSCRCNGIRGQFCGRPDINGNCLYGHVYECNPNGNTCDYGVRNSCVDCGQLSCNI